MQASVESDDDDDDDNNHGDDDGDDGDDDDDDVIIAPPVVVIMVQTNQNGIEKGLRTVCFTVERSLLFTHSVTFPAQQLVTSRFTTRYI